jgi:hypothetical protein
MGNVQQQELKQATDILIKGLLSVKNDEKVLVYSENATQSSLVDSISSSIVEAGAGVEAAALSPEKGFQSMTEELLEIIRKRNYNVICELSDHYFYQTHAWREALVKGARLFSVGGLDADAFIRCIGRVNHEKLYEFGMELRKNFLKSQKIQIFSNEGTEITIQMQNHYLPRLISKSLRKQVSYVAFPSGFLSKGIRSTFMGGQLGFQGILETIDGKAIIDGYLWPPEEIGQLNELITLEIKKGVITRIDSCPHISKLLDNWFKDVKKEVLHICIGFNPGATLSGKIMEAERVMGTVCIGFAKYPFHADAIIKQPTIKLDGQTILENGSFRTERLALLKEKLSNSEPGIFPRN